jgi:hypothetical protein
MESAPTSIEDDLNSLRSQVLRATGETNWYDTVSGRPIKTLDSDLTDMEDKRVICAVEVLQDVTVPANAYATGSLQAIVKGNLIDGETFAIDDNINPTVTFEFDTDASVVETATLRQVDISADVTAQDVSDTMVAAINGAPNLNWTADNASGTVTLVTITHDLGGTHGNGTLIAETVADAGFTLTQPTGGAGDVVTLVVASSEAPSESAAVDAGTALGAIVATLAGDVGANDLAEVSSTNPTVPKNRCLVRDADLREGLVATGAYAGKQIYALIQAEDGTADGESFNDTDKQVQLSFVMIVDDDMVPAPGQDIGGGVIEYIYPKRVSLDTLPEDCGFPGFAFTDGSASVSVTLDNAIDNQGTTPATQETDIFWDITTGNELHFRDNASVEFFGLHEGSAGGTTEVHIHAATDIFDSEAVLNDFANGARFDTDGTTIKVGETAGQIDSAGELKLLSAASSDMTLQSANEILFIDANKGLSGFSGDAKLSETSGEWDAYETAFGEVSLLNAIVQAYDAVGNVQKTCANVTLNTNEDVDVGGTAGGANLDAQIHDISGGTFITDHDVFVNGQMLRGGVDASANNDYYPGTSLALGQLKMEFKLKSGDVLCVISRQ